MPGLGPLPCPHGLPVTVSSDTHHPPLSTPTQGSGLSGRCQRGPAARTTHCNVSGSPFCRPEQLCALSSRHRISNTLPRMAALHSGALTLSAVRAKAITGVDSARECLPDTAQMAAAFKTVRTIQLDRWAKRRKGVKRSSFQL